jgi:hypothetical protein
MDQLPRARVGWVTVCMLRYADRLSDVAPPLGCAMALFGIAVLAGLS